MTHHHHSTRTYFTSGKPLIFWAKDDPEGIFSSNSFYATTLTLEAGQGKNIVGTYLASVHCEECEIIFTFFDDRINKHFE